MSAVPKKPLSSYLLFCQSERAKTPELKLTSKVLGERWRELDEYERDEFKIAPVAKPKVEMKPVLCRPPGARFAGYNQFRKIERAKQPGLSSDIIIDRWRELSDIDKKNYYRLAVLEANS